MPFNTATMGRASAALPCLAGLAWACVSPPPPVRLIPPAKSEPDRGRSQASFRLAVSGGIGGSIDAMERLAAQYAQIPEPKGWLDMGDSLTGDPVANALGGEPILRMMDRAGVDAMVLGNREFDFGVEAVARWSLTASVAFVAANLQLSPRAKVRAEVGWPCGSRRLRVRGTLDPREVERIRPGKRDGWVLKDPGDFDGWAHAVHGLRDPPSSHLNLGEARPEGGWTRDPALSVHPPEAGRGLWVLSFDCSEDRPKIVDLKLLEDVEGQVPEGVARLARAFEAQAEPILDQPVGRLDRNLPVGNFAQSPLGHFVVDAWLDRIPSADGAVLNHGALRSPLTRGQVLEGQLRSALPFDESLVLVTMTGAHLRRLLATAEPTVGGFRWRFARQGDRRVVQEVRDRYGQSVEPERRVRVILPIFVAEGGDGFMVPSMRLDGQPLPTRDTGETLRSPVRAALRREPVPSIVPQDGPRARWVR